VTNWIVGMNDSIIILVSLLTSYAGWWPLLKPVSTGKKKAPTLLK